MKAFSFSIYKDEKCQDKASDQTFANDVKSGKIEFTVPFKQGQDYAFDMQDMTTQENGRTVYAVQELEGKTVVAKDFVYYIRENTEDLPEGYYSDNAVYKVTVTMKLDEDQGKAVLVPYKVTYQRQEKDGEGFTYKEAEPVFTNEFKVLPSPAPSVSPSVTPSEEPSGTPAASITPGQSGGKGNPGSSAGGSSSGTSGYSSCMFFSLAEDPCDDAEEFPAHPVSSAATSPSASHFFISFLLLVCPVLSHIPAEYAKNMHY